MSDPRPVSAALEAFLLADVNRHQIVVWLDPHDHYSAFVDALAARTDPPFGVPIVAHRGSYLECMARLEPHLRGLDKPPLVVHVPLLNDDTIKDTPLYEVRASGFPFRKGLDTLIREAAAGCSAPMQAATLPPCRRSPTPPSCSPTTATSACRAAGADHQPGIWEAAGTGRVGTSPNLEHRRHCIVGAWAHWSLPACCSRPAKSTARGAGRRRERAERGWKQT